MISILRTCRDDIIELNNNTVEDQVLEIKASHNLSIFDAVMLGYEYSDDIWSIRKNKKLLGIFGIVPYSLLSNSATPWLLTTGEYPRELARYTKPVLSLWMREYSLLENWIDSRYTKALKWAKWAGFTIYPSVPYGPFNMLFNRIEMKK